MKLLFVLLFLVGCNATPKSEVIDGSADLLKYRDETNGVTCYRVRLYEGVSCIKG
jgi:hypothetical protein